MNIKFKHQLVWSYWAGVLTARLHNIYYSRNDLPSVVQCMRDFKILKTTFGKYYNLLKSNKYVNFEIIKYEQFSRLDLDKNLIGSYSEFMIGYSDFIKREKL